MWRASPEPYPAADALTYSTERGPVFETDPDLLLPNERGLEQLLARGALRKASLEDLNVWTIGYVNAHNRAPNSVTSPRTTATWSCTKRSFRPVWPVHTQSFSS